MDIITIDKAKKIIGTSLTTPLTRKTLIKNCVDCLSLSQDILNDKTAGKPLNIIKCRLGDAIQQLIKNGSIIENQNKELEFFKSNQEAQIEISRDIEIENIILSILNSKKCTKKELLEKICKLKSSNFSISDNALKSIAGKILKNLLSNKQIELNNQLYSIKTTEETDDEKNERLFFSLSDESLVEYSMQMLQTYFKLNDIYSVEECKNIDGPQDGGIDGIISIKDKLGYNEKFLVQVKNKINKSAYIPLCEIREFFGVFSADPEATKAIFITNAKFHKNTISFVNKIKKCQYILIDGKKWLEIAKYCNYNIPEQ